MAAGFPVGAGCGGAAGRRAGDAVPVCVQIGGMDAAADEAFGDRDARVPPVPRGGSPTGGPDGGAVKLVAVHACPGCASGDGAAATASR